MPAVPVSNEVAGQIYRLAQAQRLTRYCIERGVDPRLVSAGRLQIDLSPILDEDGTIRPEPQDVASAARPQQR